MNTRLFIRPPVRRIRLRKFLERALELIRGDPRAVRDDVGRAAVDIAHAERGDDRLNAALGDNQADQHPAERADGDGDQEHDQRAGIHAVAHHERGAHAGEGQRRADGDVNAADQQDAHHTERNGDGRGSSFLADPRWSLP